VEEAARDVLSAPDFDGGKCGVRVSACCGSTQA